MRARLTHRIFHAGIMVGAAGLSLALTIIAGAILADDFLFGKTRTD